MIGQDKLLNRIHTFTYNTFPQASMFVGEYGCGKHTIVNDISLMLDMPIKDITLDISHNLLMDSYISGIPTIYLIDIIKAGSSKKLIPLQNSILKFLEEPPQYAKIILLCENTAQILPTILNRCQVFTFEKYTPSELQAFAKQYNIDLDEKDTLVYNTPGKIQFLIDTKFDTHSMSTLVNNIIDNIHRANPANVLTIVNKFDLSNDGFMLDIFIHQMKLELAHRLITADNFMQLKEYYSLTLEFSRGLSLLGINKQSLFENYLLRLKLVTE